MRSRVSASLLFLAAFVAVAVCGWSQSATRYDLASETKIKGVVEEVRELPAQQGGTQLVVKTDTKTVVVQVGPADFLKEMETSFNKGDQVEVTGAKTTDASGEQILAREITVGTNTFTLRDDKGVPVWTGWKPAKAFH